MYKVVTSYRNSLFVNTTRAQSPKNKRNAFQEEDIFNNSNFETLKYARCSLKQTWNIRKKKKEQNIYE